MSIFSKKDHVRLEDLVPVIVMTAFEYPFEQNIQKAQNEKRILTTEELAKAKGQVVPFIIAVNLALLKFTAEQGKIARFKGDDPNMPAFTQASTCSSMNFLLVHRPW